MERNLSTILQALTFAALAVYVSGKDCGKFNITGSLDLPSNLPEGNNCTWTIVKDKKNKDAMAVYLIDVSISHDDSLVISDGQAEVISLTRGSVTSQVAAVFGDATVVFTVGKSTIKSQGQIHFNTKECVASLTNNIALQVTGPVFDNNQTDVNCTYQVTNQLQDRTAVVSFTEFSMDAGSSVELSSGDNDQTYKGSDQKLQPDFFSDPNNETVTVIFLNKKSNDNVSLAFMAYRTSCTDDMELGNVSLTVALELPSAPDVAYACLARFKNNAGSGGAVLARFRDLTLSASDSLTLVDGGASLGQRLAQLDGSDLGVSPDYLSLSTAPSMLATLTLSPSVATRSLNISFETVKDGGRFTGGGILKAGAASDLDDGADVIKAYYQLVSTKGHQVKLKLETPLTNDSTLTIYRGLQTSDGVLITLRSDALDKGLTTIVGEPQMLVILDKFPATDNFTARFSSVASDCDQLATLPYGQLSTDPASQLDVCKWIIAPSIEGVTVLNFNSLSLDVNTTVKVYMKPDEAIATFKGPAVSTPIPQINVPKGMPARVSIYYTGKDQTKSKVTVSYKVVPQVCGGPLAEPRGSLSTPNFPNQYPLFAQCVWSQQSQASLFYLTFRKLDLSQNHSISVTDMNNSTLETLATYGGSANSSANLPEDLIVEAGNTTSVTFSSVAQSGGDINSVGTGALVDYWILGCGGNVSGSSKGSLSSPGYPKPSTAPTSCRWILKLPALSVDDKDSQSVQFKVTAKGAQLKNIHKYLKIYDGPGIRYPLSTANATNGTSGTVLSRYASLTVVYDVGDGVKDKVAFNLTFTRYVCNTSEQCDNGICMHKDWICNYKDDCGDGTDEQNCVFPRPTPAPPQPPQDYSGWVKTGWVPGALFIGIILGVGLLFIIPRIVRRLRSGGSGSYNRMSDDSPVIA